VTNTVAGRGLLEDPEAVQHRHLHVEEHQLRRLRLDHLERFATVAGDADHLDLVVALQELQQPGSGGFLVVDHEGANGVHGSFRGSLPPRPSRRPHFCCKRHEFVAKSADRTMTRPIRPATRGRGWQQRGCPGAVGCVVFRWRELDRL
jgi:hypothetical protein